MPPMYLFVQCSPSELHWLITPGRFLPCGRMAANCEAAPPLALKWSLAGLWGYPSTLGRNAFVSLFSFWPICFSALLWLFFKQHWYFRLKIRFCTFVMHPRSSHSPLFGPCGVGRCQVQCIPFFWWFRLGFDGELNQKVLRRVSTELMLCINPFPLL